MKPEDTYKGWSERKCGECQHHEPYRALTCNQHRVVVYRLQSACAFFTPRRPDHREAQ